MPALNYQDRFASKVESGEKRQTIRRVWKRPIKLGDTLYHYTGMRTKHCRKLRTAVCKFVEKIRITDSNIQTEFNFLAWRSVALNRFAHKDGFDSWEEMRDWFDKRYGLPFEGVLITW